MKSTLLKLFGVSEKKENTREVSFTVAGKASRLTHGGPGGNEEWTVSPTQSFGKPLPS